MSTTEQRRAANRVNALNSTGPTSTDGKIIASRNATRHGLLSQRLLLDDEEPAEFDALLAELSASLSPVGMLEMTLVERVAVCLWRQRRLVSAETSNIALERQPRWIAVGVSKALGKSYGSEMKPGDLAPFDADRERWCRKALEEADALEQIDLASIEATAPTMFEQLRSDAEADKQTPEAFLADHKGGLASYIGELLLWCRRQITEAEERPKAMALATHVRAQRLLLSADTLDVIARYQTTLDNQLYKALKALRQAQEWRLKTIEAAPSTRPAHPLEEDVAEAA